MGFIELCNSGNKAVSYGPCPFASSSAPHRNHRHRLCYPMLSGNKNGSISKSEAESRRVVIVQQRSHVVCGNMKKPRPNNQTGQVIDTALGCSDSEAQIDDKREMGPIMSEETHKKSSRQAKEVYKKK